MEERPAVSVILLTWIDTLTTPEELAPVLARRAAHIRGMLVELRRMAGIDHELIIVSNGDHLHHRVIVRAAEHREIHPEKVLLLGKNIGTAWGRHEGARVATGDFLCFLDDDFAFTADWLYTMWQLASSMDAVVSGHKWPRAPINEEHEHYVNVPWPSDNCMLLRRRYYEDIGGYATCPPCRARPLMEALADQQARHPFLIPKPAPCIHWGADLSCFFQRQSHRTWKLIWKGPDELGVDPNAGPR